MSHNDVAYPSALPEGTRVGNVTLDHAIGQGAWGIVYEGQHPWWGRVAVKEYFPSTYATRHQSGGLSSSAPQWQDAVRRGLERFGQEGRALRGIRHENVVPVHDFVENDGAAFLVMEFIEGETLGAACAGGRFSDPEAVIALASTLVDTLQAIHAKNVLHRDIAPDNIMIRPDGSPVLIDFGGAAAAIASVTRSTQNIVKDGYSPPEQYDTSGNPMFPIGPWSDIYATACVLFRVASGNEPAVAHSRLLAVGMRGGLDPIVHLESLAPPGYTRQWLKAVDAALALAPSDRPQSAVEWRRTFEDISERGAAADRLRKQRDDENRKQREEQARLEAQRAAAEARRQREEQAEREAARAAEAARKQREEQSRREAERAAGEEARKQREEEARKQREEEARKQREEQARREAEAARKKREDEARLAAQLAAKEEARRQREEEAGKQREEEARKQREEQARREAERAAEAARKKREDEARLAVQLAAKEEARKQREDEARKQRAEQARREAERAAEAARKKREDEARLAAQLAAKEEARKDRGRRVATSEPQSERTNTIAVPASIAAAILLVVGGVVAFELRPHTGAPKNTVAALVTPQPTATLAPTTAPRPPTAKPVAPKPAASATATARPPSPSPSPTPAATKSPPVVRVSPAPARSARPVAAADVPHGTKNLAKAAPVVVPTAVPATQAVPIASAAAAPAATPAPVEVAAAPARPAADRSTPEPTYLGKYVVRLPPLGPAGSACALQSYTRSFFVLGYPSNVLTTTDTTDTAPVQNDGSFHLVYVSTGNGNKHTISGQIVLSATATTITGTYITEWDSRGHHLCKFTFDGRKVSQS